MADWNILKKAIADVIKTNGNQGITGQLLQDVLNNIVSSVGENSTFAGVATPATNPGTPDGNVFYLTASAGIYSNFSGIEITTGEAVILEWRGSWAKKTLGLATQEKLAEIENEVKDTGGGPIIVEYETDIATTRLNVASKRRRQGLEITYMIDDKWKQEKYIGISSSDSEWKKASNWIDVSNGYCNASFAYPENDTSTVSKAAALIPSSNYKNNFVIALIDSDGKSQIYIFKTSAPKITYGEWTKTSNWRKIACIDEVYTKEESNETIDTSINNALYDMKLLDWGVVLI